jgi:hypothetical protein
MEASSLAYIDTEYGIPSMEHYVDSLIEQVRRELSVDEYNTAREALSLGWPSYRLTRLSLSTLHCPPPHPNHSLVHMHHVRIIPIPRH